MRNDNKRRISSIMKQLQNLNQPQRNPRVGTPIKYQEVEEDKPFSNDALPTLDPRPRKSKTTQVAATTSTLAPKRTTPRRKPQNTKIIT